LDPITIGIVDENEIFRRGLVACLGTDAGVVVEYDSDRVQSSINVSLLVASPAVAASQAFPVPLVVCTDAALGDDVRELNSVMGILPRASLKPAQLAAAVRAAASGLRVNLLESPSCNLSTRNVQVLKLLAQGAATRRISDELGYSERTIKHAVAEIMDELGAKSRAEAVALGIRSGLI